MPADPTDDAILDAAESLLDERGELGMAAIARRAGVSRGTVYRRFGDRDALLARVAERRGVAADALVKGPRERVIDGVSQVLARDGLDGLTVEAVAAAAGIGVATVYRHFEGRDGLLAAFAAERSPRRLVAMLDESPGDDIAGDLGRLAEAGVRFVRAQPALVRLMMGEVGAGLSSRLGGGRGARAALVDYFERQVEAGRLRGRPRSMALAFAAIVLALGSDAQTDPEHAIRFSVDLFLSGLRPP